MDQHLEVGPTLRSPAPDTAWEDLDRGHGLKVVRNKPEAGFTIKNFQARAIPTSYFGGMERLLYEHPETAGWCIRPGEENRRAVYHTTFNKVFPEVAAKAEVPDARPHDLRRSFATDLASAGVSPWEVSAALGHSALATTLRYTAYVPPGQVKRVF